VRGGGEVAVREGWRWRAGAGRRFDALSANGGEREGRRCGSASVPSTRLRTGLREPCFGGRALPPQAGLRQDERGGALFYGEARNGTEMFREGGCTLLQPLGEQYLC
jgi:hypothetical protein